MREMNFGSDASFSEEAIITRVNADLANDLGNLFSRVLSMNAKYFGGRVPPHGAPDEADDELSRLTDNACVNYVQMFRQMRCSQALDSLWESVRAMNKYVDVQAPWTLAREGKNERLGAVLRTLLEAMYRVAALLWPVMPSSSAAMQEQLGRPCEESRFSAARLDDLLKSRTHLRTGESIAVKSALFPRLEMPAREDAPKADTKAKADSVPQGEPASAAPGGAKPFIEFPDFEKLDLRVGIILAAEQHPNADKLLRFDVDLGEEKPRQICSGIAASFKPEELLGKRVIVVANLPPRKLRGLESQGMILTAEWADGLALPSADAPAGSAIR